MCIVYAYNESTQCVKCKRKHFRIQLKLLEIGDVFYCTIH